MPKLADIQSEFYCTRCGRSQKFSIPRLSGQARPAGHLKKMHCFYCGEEVNFCEIKRNTKYDYIDFLIEFEGHNFDDKGNRKLPSGIFKDKLIKGKTYYTLLNEVVEKYKNELKEKKIWLD